MRKHALDRVLEGGHTNFLVDAIRTNKLCNVTQWVKASLMNSSSNLDKRSKDAFFNAEKSLIVEYIMEQDFLGLTKLLDAIDNKEQLKDEANYNKLKLNQCKVLTDAMKMAKRFLDEDKVMHKDLRDLLTERQNELQGMDSEEEEQNFKSFKEKVSTAIDEALKIVPVSTEPSQLASSSQVSR